MQAGSGGESALNLMVADKLREGADLLEQQGGNPFRVSAYRRAAEQISSPDVDLAAILRREGPKGLTALPHVGKGIAGAIVEIFTTGRWSLLERLRGSLDPEKLFQSIPGVGPGLARVLHETLHVDSLEALESAAYDGRLEKVPGVGPRRAASLRASLERMLGRLPRHREAPAGGPGAAVLLDVDEEYRRRAAAGDLPTISPKRFNPDGTVRLPVLHTVRGSWHLTALFSNTPRAHELGRTRDWVVVYFYDEHHQEGQHTVVDETRGPLAGRRVVRGLEEQCLALYTVTSMPPKDRRASRKGRKRL